ncbi:hypothetical protein ACE38V_18680 [Cytobacillus sp. Hz8]|uniref:hypothetical protein n=1 Tax=Cytobacillus sp. Hz8 TaxID=3347168 RepID=UPI0035E1C378
MKEYQQYLQERDKIDYFIQKGYRIKMITENLSGAFVEFEKREINQENSVSEILHILTADARKYFSVKLMEQQKT